MFGCLWLAGCGFTPVHRQGGNETSLRGRIEFATPSDEEGFALVKRLEDRLGQPQSADLLLNADIRISEDALGFLPDGQISRFHVIGRVNWRLSKVAEDAVLIQGREQSFTSYSATSTTVATRFARRDARRRLMVILADRIASDLFSRNIP